MQQLVVQYLERQIKNSPQDVAKALLAILKYQTAQKAEFSAFNKLNGDVGQIKREVHKVHKVLMNVFYLFFNDFTDKSVMVNIGASEVSALFDYDSIHVCAYHLVENAAKYEFCRGILTIECESVFINENNEIFANSTSELVLSALDNIVAEVNNDSFVSSINKNKEIIKRLYDKGIFNIKDSPNLVADYLKISKNTVYLHLRNYSK